MPEWDQIVRENTRRVFGIALRILGSKHDAEDVTQDVFLEAIELPTPQKIHDWPGLLRRMTTLRSIDRLRKRRPTTLIDANLPIASSTGDEVVAKELAERLRQALLQLSDRQAAVFTLAYFEWQSQEEIAVSLDMTPAAVSTALYKARQTLKSLLIETTEETDHG